jgi:hypothetical protein
MARKTKDELAAEHKAYVEQQLEQRRLEYPARLMQVLEDATLENFEIQVHEGNFIVEDRDDYGCRSYTLAYHWCESFNDELQSLEREVQYKKAARIAREKQYLVREQALAKLTQQEREALGL